MSAAADRSQHARRLAAQGWSDEAIAAGLHMSVEQVRRLLDAAEENPQLTSDLPTAEGTRNDRAEFSAPAAADPIDRKQSQAATVEVLGAAEKRKVEKRKAGEDAGKSKLERLEKQRTEQHAEGLDLRAEIERLALTDRKAGNRKYGRASRIRPQLTRPAALRTVQWHLAAIARRLGENLPET